MPSADDRWRRASSSPLPKRQSTPNAAAGGEPAAAAVTELAPLKLGMTVNGERRCDGTIARMQPRRRAGARDQSPDRDAGRPTVGPARRLKAVLVDWRDVASAALRRSHQACGTADTGPANSPAAGRTGEMSLIRSAT